MTLGAAVAGAVPYLRAQAESQMVDTCTITQAGTKTFDETTGTYTDAAAREIYSGACRVKPWLPRSDRQVEAGDQPVQVWPYTVSVPLTALGVLPGQTCTINTSGDPDLVGLALIVRDVGRGSQVTARRLGCVTQEAMT